MKQLLPILFLLFSNHTQSASSTDLSSLTSLEWKHRVIIANMVNNPEHLVETFEKNTFDIDERVIIWFVIQPQALLTNYRGNMADNFATNIQNRYQLKEGQVVLFGKGR